IDAYTAVAGLGILPGAVLPVVKRFQDDHKSHAAALTEVIKKAGGEPFECANERINTLYIAPAVELITGNNDKGIEASDTPVDDLLVLAHGLENLAAATYQYYVSLIAQPAVRGAAMTIGQDEARHAAVLAQAIIPDGKGIAPSINEKTGKPNPAAVPSAFGSLAAISFAIGKTSEAGTKTQLSLDTPSLNSLAYEYASC
ncbi:MAG: ferritin-like domain-containing protein, partial [Actinomycetota bacterium]